MFVSDWMTKKLYTLDPGDSLSDAVRTMQGQGIKHLPVVSRGRLRGIVSDRDVREFGPSRASTLDIHELHYLLATTRVREFMRKDVITTSPAAPVEEAALTMLDNNIGCLPVLDRGNLVGIISDRDIFRVLVDVTAIRHGGNRIAVAVEDVPGSIKDLTDIVRKYGFSLQSILSSHEGQRHGMRRIVIRTKGAGNYRGLKQELEGRYNIVSVKKG